MAFQKHFKNNSQNMVFFEQGVEGKTHTKVFFKNNSRTKKIREQFKEFKEFKNEWPYCHV